MCDIVFVFKEFRLAYKCAAGEYHAFKVRPINLLVSLLAAMRRILKKDAKDGQRKKQNKEMKVYQGGDHV